LIEKLLQKQRKAMQMINQGEPNNIEDDDSSSSSGQSIGNGEDDDPDNALLPEDASEDEDFDEPIGGIGFNPKGIAPEKSIESTSNVQKRIKKSLVTCTTTNTTSRLNDDIYMNNGNVELKLPKAPVKPIHL
jgi:hypothetical protein